jgi:hypothetical protein
LPWQPARRSRRSPPHAKALAQTMSAPPSPGTSGLAALKSAKGSSTPRSRLRRRHDERIHDLVIGLGNIASARKGCTPRDRNVRMLGRPHRLHLGETGQATWRTFTIGELRARLVEYSAGYTADHCCDLGHVLYVVEGELDTELRHGRTFKLRPGMSCQVSDRGDAEHRSSTQAGAKLFIVD